MCLWCELNLEMGCVSVWSEKWAMVKIFTDQLILIQLHIRFSRIIISKWRNGTVSTFPSIWSCLCLCLRIGRVRTCPVSGFEPGHLGVSTEIRQRSSKVWRNGAEIKIFRKRNQKRWHSNDGLRWEQINYRICTDYSRNSIKKPVGNLTLNISKCSEVCSIKTRKRQGLTLSWNSNQLSNGT